MVEKTQTKTLMSNGDSMPSEKVQKTLPWCREKRSRRIPLFLAHMATWQSCSRALLSVSPSRPWVMYLTHLSLQRRHSLSTAFRHNLHTFKQLSPSWQHHSQVTQNVIVFNIYLCPNILSPFKTLQPGYGTGGTGWGEQAGIVGTFKSLLRQAAWLLVPHDICFFTYIYSYLFLIAEKGLAELINGGSSFESVLLQVV